MIVCKHETFSANVAVNRLEDSGRFLAEITVSCSQCEMPFRFLGLTIGLDTAGARISPSGTEARIAIAPLGEEQPDYSGVTGFEMKITGTH